MIDYSDESKLLNWGWLVPDSWVALALRNEKDKAAELTDVDSSASTPVK